MFLQCHGMLDALTCPTTNIATPITSTHLKSWVNVGRQALTAMGERWHPGQFVWLSWCLGMFFFSYKTTILIFFTVYAACLTCPTTNNTTPMTSTHSKSRAPTPNIERQAVITTAERWHPGHVVWRVLVSSFKFHSMFLNYYTNFFYSVC